MPRTKTPQPKKERLLPPELYKILQVIYAVGPSKPIAIAYVTGQGEQAVVNRLEAAGPALVQPVANGKWDLVPELRATFEAAKIEGSALLKKMLAEGFEKR